MTSGNKSQLLVWQVEDICRVSNVTKFIFCQKQIAVLSRNVVVPNRFPVIHVLFFVLPEDVLHR